MRPLQRVNLLNPLDRDPYRDPYRPCSCGAVHTIGDLLLRSQPSVDTVAAPLVPAALALWAAVNESG